MKPGRILIVSAIVLASLVIGVWIVLRPGGPPDLPPLPDPNGHDDLLRAQKMLNWTTTMDAIDTANRAGLEEFVRANAEPLRLAREALTKECRVPIEFTEEWFNNMVLSGALSSFMTLAMAMSCEARYLLLSGNTNAAARAYLDIARIGDSGLEGGIVMHYLTEVALESSALDDLKKITDGLNATQCRMLIGAVAALEDDDEAFEATLKLDRTWTRHAFTLKERLQGMWESRSLDIGGTDSQSVRSARIRHHRRIRQLVVDLAVRAFEVDHGREPRTAGELIPDYLERIPKDPETGKPLH